MFWTHDGNKIDFEFDSDIHFLNEFFPILKGKVENFADIELLKIIFLLEAG